MSLNRGKLEDTEGVREAEFVVLDFIRSTPDATIPEIARLIDDVGADLRYIANELGIDPDVAQQAYDEAFAVAPPIEQVIEKQINAEPIVPPQAPLAEVITVGPGSSNATDVPVPPAAPEPQVRENIVPDEPTPTAPTRDVVTGAPAGPTLPVGLAASEQAIRDAEERARQDLLTTFNISRGDLERGTAAASEALAGGTRRARSDIEAGTQSGLEALREGLGGARTDIEAGFGRAEGMFDPYTQAGRDALQRQLALSGALGQEEFQQAYQESPQMQFLREQGERAALRTAAARGGLGGGRVMQELARYGTGLASQDLQNQIANLQALSSQGLGATGSAANIATGGAQQLANLGVLGGTSGLQAYTQQGTQLADLAQQLGVREADLQQALGAGQANIALGLGTRAADLSAGMGTNIAGMRTRAGELLAGQFGTAASQLGDLQQAQGAGAANMLGAQTNYINQLQQAAAAGDAAAQTELAQMQANINLGIGSSLAGVPAAQLFPVANAAGSILEGAALGYQLGEGFGTPSTARQTYPIADMTQMTGTAPAGYQAYNPFQISASNLGEL